MPNVNTLIVENSENFGLAQLHQLRGRVGRSSIQAYAYLLTKHKESVSDEGMKRLELLMSHQELGAGFQLANYDLELRGAGNLIGKQQSGQIAGVGLELYVDMLEEKIKELSSIKTEKKHDPEIRIKVTALIPSSYIAEDKERLDLYKKFFSASASEEIIELQHSTEDRYGTSSSEFNTLVQVALLRLRIRKIGAEAIIELDKSKYEIRLLGPAKKKIEIRLENLKANASDFVRMEKLLAVIPNS
jgi:transcription-repair coupling factor (superfamily II helicase)